MKKTQIRKTIIAIAFAVLVGLTVGNVKADTITLTIPASYGQVANYVGLIGSPEPSNLPAEVFYITNLITVPIGNSQTVIYGTHPHETSHLLDRTLSNLTSLLPVTGLNGVQGPADVNSFTAGFTGEGYILGKYDGPNYGDVVWLVSFDFGDVIVLPTTAPGGYGLSHYATLTTSVPEPGILILLGIAMSAIGAASWKISKL